jgi:hypothetical protein
MTAIYILVLALAIPTAIFGWLARASVRRDMEAVKLQLARREKLIAELGEMIAQEPATQGLEPTIEIGQPVAIIQTRINPPKLRGAIYQSSFEGEAYRLQKGFEILVLERDVRIEKGEESLARRWGRVVGIRPVQSDEASGEARAESQWLERVYRASVH